MESKNGDFNAKTNVMEGEHLKAEKDISDSEVHRLSAEAWNFWKKWKAEIQKQKLTDEQWAVALAELDTWMKKENDTFAEAIGMAYVRLLERRDKTRQ